MVFSTLHTNDSPSTITRLRDMGVEPFLITATVEAILAQRLVRKICQFCKTGYDPSREQLMELNMKAEDLKGRQFYFGEGCDKCNNLGFKGRTGIYEMLIMNDDLRDMVSRGASTDALRNAVRSGGLAVFANGVSICCSTASVTWKKSSAKRCSKTKVDCRINRILGEQDRPLARDSVPFGHVDSLARG